MLSKGSFEALWLLSLNVYLSHSAKLSFNFNISIMINKMFICGMILSDNVLYTTIADLMEPRRHTLGWLPIMMLWMLQTRLESSKLISTRFLFEKTDYLSAMTILIYGMTSIFSSKLVRCFLLSYCNACWLVNRRMCSWMFFVVCIFLTQMTSLISIHDTI